MIGTKTISEAGQITLEESELRLPLAGRIPSSLVVATIVSNTVFVRTGLEDNGKGNRTVLASMGCVIRIV